MGSEKKILLRKLPMHFPQFMPAEDELPTSPESGYYLLQATGVLQERTAEQAPG